MMLSLATAASSALAVHVDVIVDKWRLVRVAT